MKLFGAWISDSVEPAAADPGWPGWGKRFGNLSLVFAPYLIDTDGYFQEDDPAAGDPGMKTQQYTKEASWDIYSAN